MTSAIKSYSFSLIVHATLVAALYVIPASTQQRFASNGQRQVIAIEATHGDPSPASPDSITVPTTPLVTTLDSDIDRIVPAERIHDSVAVDSFDRPETSGVESPTLPPPPDLPTLQIDQQPSLQRREREQPPPISTVTIDPPLLRKPPPVPIAGGNAVPLDPFVGLKANESADLSNNPPPSYPLEAVRRRLEGVVLLRLRIGVAGNVTGVDLIESSGHTVLDQAAMKAVASWQGRPAKRWGRPVDSVEHLPIRFRL